MYTLISSGSRSTMVSRKHLPSSRLGSQSLVTELQSSGVMHSETGVNEPPGRPREGVGGGVTKPSSTEAQSVLGACALQLALCCKREIIQSCRVQITGSVKDSSCNTKKSINNYNKALL